MENKSLEITIISAKGIKKVKHLCKMDVYVVATISSDPNTEQKTPIAKDGGTSPKWNSSIKFNVNESLAQTITFKVRCKRQIRGDKDIGEVIVTIKELLNKDANSAKYVTYPVRKSSGKQKGELNFMFQFSNKINNIMHSPVTAYPPMMNPMFPPPHNAATTPPYPPAGYPQVGYHRPENAGGYGEHGQATYPMPPLPPAGYPPVGQGYGYPLAVQPQQVERTSELGALGAALVGVLGGLLIGDLVSEGAAGYDGGFQDESGDFGC